MKSLDTDRVVRSSGVQNAGSFGIDAQDQAHVMGLLRDAIYSDKILAVIREYGSNAYDAHRQFGKGDLPIEIHVPTVLEPYFVVRDFGPGMSEDEVFRIYTRYGASTKRNTNDAVGCLGIGSKSGFAYSDSFGITAWNGGVKKVYVAVLDESDCGEIKLMFEEPCDPSETGIEISIAVRSKDIEDFESRSENFFKYFEPRPKINIELPEMVRHSVAQGYILGSRYDGWTAHMGCVPYKLDISQIEAELDAHGILSLVHRLAGGLHFQIGEVQVVASREELKYTDKTKAAVAARMAEMIEAYREESFAVLADPDLSGWQKRLKVSFLRNRLGMSVPKRYVHWDESDSARLIPETQETNTFVFSGGHYGVPSVRIREDFGIWINDKPEQEQRGYDFNGSQIIVTPKPDCTLEAVEEELQEILKTRNMDGLPLKRLSSAPWRAPYVPTWNAPTKKPRDKYPTNAKHYARSFTFKGGNTYHAARSQYWEISEVRAPEESDVYVILASFEAVGYSQFYTQVREDRELAEFFNVPFPSIYGYKTTTAKPVTEADITGIPYPEWRKTFIRSLATNDFGRHLEMQRFRDLVERRSNYRYGLSQGCRALMQKFDTLLGADHDIARIFSTYQKTAQSTEKIPKGYRELAAHLELIWPETETCQNWMNDLIGRYPLLSALAYNPIESLMAHPGDWAEYIKMMDAAKNYDISTFRNIDSVVFKEETQDATDIDPAASEEELPADAEVPAEPEEIQVNEENAA